MIDECFEQALRSANPLSALVSLAMQSLSQGENDVTILERFEIVRQALRQANREQDEYAVMDVMDFLVGWCSPHMQLPTNPTSQAAAPSSVTKG
jgi:hypothetical protein